MARQSCASSDWLIILLCCSTSHLFNSLALNYIKIKTPQILLGRFIFKGCILKIAQTHFATCGNKKTPLQKLGKTTEPHC